MEHTSADLGKNFLAHYGVLGMHWGIRKTIADERAQYHETMKDPKTARNARIGQAFVGTALMAYGVLALAALKM